MEWSDLAVEDHCLYMRVLFKTEIDCTRKEELKDKLVDKYVDKLIYLFEKSAPDSYPHCASIICKTSDLNLIRSELKRHFTSIRGCSVDSKTLDADSSQLTFYSPPKDINLNVSFFDSKSTFEVEGSTKNLGKFLYGYSKSIQNMSGGTIDTSSLTMKTLTHPERMTLCQKIERNLAHESEPWEPFTDDETDSANEDETQEPSTTENQPVTLATNTPDNDTPPESQQTLDPPLIINETPLPSSSYDQKLDMIIQKLTSLETNTAQLSSRIDNVLTTIDGLTKRIEKAENKLDKMEQILPKYESMKTEIEKLECRIHDIEEKNSEMNVSPISSDPLPFPTSQDIIQQLIDAKFKEYTSRPKTQPQKHAKYEPTTIDEVDHDLFLVGDSNTYGIKENILKNGKSATKVMAYQIDHAINALEIVKVKRPPQKLMIHVGCNHLSSDAENNLDEIKENYNKLFQLIDKKFPDTDIHLSEIFLRRERNLESEVKELNMFLASACKTRHNYQMIKHSFNIDSPYHHLRDNRHLSPAGFHNFLINIRLQMLGIPNRYRSKQQPTQFWGFNFKKK